ncbi:DUF3000 domain-containing protein [Aeromicrobium sp. Leaf350]|uniref:DUF3000 domain-containing protein n=1 Tax=Aeromicrobium sp. Leaf350 TaxID=2876565 RepID=UPI001E5EAB9E|nr:DUF3000 domain-containing protein [Aeromicrobium sp. Leaf350]
MGAHTELGAVPSQFAAAVDQLRSAAVRPEVVIDVMPAPTRIAPHAYALSGEIVAGDEDLASGRFILLHDPAGHDAWNGTFRCVTFARADIEGYMAEDPVLPAVGWSWLEDALETRGAEATAFGGSVTVVHTEAFGSMVDDAPQSQVEVRASWTPLTGVADHLGAWGDLLAAVAGLPPLSPDVAYLPGRGRHGPAGGGA